MNALRWVVLAASIFAAASVRADEARPRAEQPATQVGDEWTYSVTANSHYMGKRRYTVAGETTFRGRPALRVTSKLIEVRSDKVREFLEDGDLFFTPEGAWMGESRGPGRVDYADPPLPMTLWPLEVAKSWSATVSFYFELFDRPDEPNRFRVTGYGPVMVPAGTFEAFHLERRSRDATIFYWYAPKVKNIIKYGGVDWRDDVNYLVELVSYRLKE